MPGHPAWRSRVGNPATGKGEERQVKIDCEFALLVAYAVMSLLYWTAIAIFGLYIIGYIWEAMQ